MLVEDEVCVDCVVPELGCLFKFIQSCLGIKPRLVTLFRCDAMPGFCVQQRNARPRGGLDALMQFQFVLMPNFYVVVSTYMV